MAPFHMQARAEEVGDPGKTSVDNIAKLHISKRNMNVEMIENTIEWIRGSSNDRLLRGKASQAYMK